LIKVCIELKTNNPEKVTALLLEARNEAMKHRGYITGETLVNSEDPTDMMVISTWESLDYQQDWDKSETWLKMSENINQYLISPYKLRTFQNCLFKANRVFSTF
jgi:heme-degrading monooxygenase HmoA